MTDFAATLAADRGQPAHALHVVHPDDYAGWLASQPARVRATCAAAKVTGKAGNRAILPGEGEDWSALLVCDEGWDSVQGR